MQIPLVALRKCFGWATSRSCEPRHAGPTFRSYLVVRDRAVVGWLRLAWHVDLRRQDVTACGIPDRRRRSRMYRRGDLCTIVARAPAIKARRWLMIPARSIRTCQPRDDSATSESTRTGPVMIRFVASAFSHPAPPPNMRKVGKCGVQPPSASTRHIAVTARGVIRVAACTAAKRKPPATGRRRAAARTSPQSADSLDSTYSPEPKV